MPVGNGRMGSLVWTTPTALRFQINRVDVLLDYYDSSAVAIGLLGRKVKARYLNESTVQCSAAAEKGKFVVLIGSAASFDQTQDTAALTLANLDTAASKDFKSLLAETSAWWHDFWSSGWVAMSSGDKQADFVGQNYTYLRNFLRADGYAIITSRREE